MRDWTQPSLSASQAFGKFDKKTEIGILSDQVAALTDEVKQLKKMLEPLPSFILTGQQVLAEFERLQKRQT